MELDNGRLSFVTQEKVAGTVAVHKSVLRERCSTSRVAKDVESSFLVCVAVGVIEAHPMTGQVLQSGLAKMVGQQISGSLARRSVAAPAFRIVPFVATAGGIHVDGDQSDVARSQLRAKEVDPAAALGKKNVFVFRNQEFGINTEGEEGGHNPAGDFAVVRPFEETAVGTSFTRCFLAVSVVD